MPVQATRELFGGAITTVLPSDLIDAADLRQVPDTQEVLLYPDSGVSIVAEVLQSVDANEFADIARFHFDSLAHDNDAEEQSVQAIAQLSGDDSSQTPPPTVLAGTQLVRKFNSTHADEVRVLMAIYRVKDHNIDLVMTMNVPMKTSENDAVSEDEWLTAKEIFEIAARSLRIVDYGLFA